MAHLLVKLKFQLIFQDFCDTIINQNNNSDKIKRIYENIINQAKTMEALRVSAEKNEKIRLSEIA